VEGGKDDEITHGIAVFGGEVKINDVSNNNNNSASG